MIPSLVRWTAAAATVVLIGGLTAACTFVAPTPASTTSDSAVPAAALEVMNQPQYSHASWSMSVSDLDTGEVLLDLPFRFGQKRKVPAIAAYTRSRPHGEGAGIPERVQQARPALQFPDALRAPRQVILLLARRLLQLPARLRIARGKCLPLIQRLRANLAHMVHPHQPRRMRPVLLAQRRLFNRG